MDLMFPYNRAKVNKSSLVAVSLHHIRFVMRRIFSLCFFVDFCMPVIPWGLELLVREIV